MVFISSGEVRRGYSFSDRPVYLNKRSTLVVLFSTLRDVWAGAGGCQVWGCMVGNIQHACTMIVTIPNLRKRMGRGCQVGGFMDIQHACNMIVPSPLIAHLCRLTHKPLPACKHGRGKHARRVVRHLVSERKKEIRPLGVSQGKVQSLHAPELQSCDAWLLIQTRLT